MELPRSGNEASIPHYRRRPKSLATRSNSSLNDHQVLNSFKSLINNALEQIKTPEGLRLESQLSYFIHRNISYLSMNLSPNKNDPRERLDIVIRLNNLDQPDQVILELVNNGDSTIERAYLWEQMPERLRSLLNEGLIKTTRNEHDILHAPDTHRRRAA